VCLKTTLGPAVAVPFVVPRIVAPQRHTRPFDGLVGCKVAGPRGEVAACAVLFFGEPGKRSLCAASELAPPQTADIALILSEHWLSILASTWANEVRVELRGRPGGVSIPSSSTATTGLSTGDSNCWRAQATWRGVTKAEEDAVRIDVDMLDFDRRLAGLTNLAGLLGEECSLVTLGEAATCVSSANAVATSNAGRLATPGSTRISAGGLSACGLVPLPAASETLPMSAAPSRGPGPWGIGGTFRLASSPCSLKIEDRMWRARDPSPAWAAAGNVAKLSVNAVAAPAPAHISAARWPGSALKRFLSDSLCQCCLPGITACVAAGVAGRRGEAAGEPVPTRLSFAGEGRGVPERRLGDLGEETPLPVQNASLAALSLIWSPSNSWRGLLGRGLLGRERDRPRPGERALGEASTPSKGTASLRLDS